MSENVREPAPPACNAAGSKEGIEFWDEVDRYEAARQEDAARLEVKLQEVALLRRVLRAVNDNALVWHSGEDGKARALNVIAVWTSEALAGRLHPGAEAITEALDVGK